MNSVSKGIIDALNQIKSNNMMNDEDVILFRKKGRLIFIDWLLLLVLLWVCELWMLFWIRIIHIISFWFLLNEYFIVVNIIFGSKFSFLVSRFECVHAILLNDVFLWIEIWTEIASIQWIFWLKISANALQLQTIVELLPNFKALRFNF